MPRGRGKSHEASNTDKELQATKDFCNWEKSSREESSYRYIVFFIIFAPYSLNSCVLTITKQNKNLHQVQFVLPICPKCVAIHWSMARLPGPMPLKLDSPFPSSCQGAIAPQLGLRLHAHSQPLCWDFCMAWVCKEQETLGSSAWNGTSILNAPVSRLRGHHSREGRKCGRARDSGWLSGNSVFQTQWTDTCGNSQGL